MSSVSGFIVLLFLASVVPHANAWWWGWGDKWKDYEWGLSKPANCPHENTETHVCSTLYQGNATCYEIKCCGDLDTSGDCDRLCVSAYTCTVYECVRKCCDGYKRDYMGRCQEKTDSVQCENGGTLFDGKCSCPRNFTGVNCEIPECHCENGGQCEVRDGRPQCNCSTGYYGERCELARCSLKCENGGRCLRNATYGYEVCICPENFVGKRCEYDYVHPDTCPAPLYQQSCFTECTSNNDCGGGEVCCKEGYGTVCREPLRNICKRDGQEFRTGEKYQPTPCETCVCSENGEMMCRIMACDIPVCLDGRKPVTVDGLCCPVCPGKPTIHCPSHVVKMNTSAGRDFAVLAADNVPVRAWSSAGTGPLQVKFSPERARYCRCVDPLQHQTHVKAYVEENGHVAVCTFSVAVYDNEAPVFRTCPEDIYVFEDEVVDWMEPVYEDNVEVKATFSGIKKGHTYPVGTYLLKYKARDLAGNTATCCFRAEVTSLDTPVSEMPQGLRDRSKDKSHLVPIIVTPVVVVMAIALLVLILVCCIRRKRASDATSVGSKPAHRTPAYDNNLYADPTDMKVPEYNELPLNPPPYSSRAGSMRDVTYLPVAPPSYSNPGYETLQVDKLPKLLTESEMNMSGSASMKSDNSQK